MEEQLTAQDWLNAAYYVMDVSLRVGSSAYPFLAGVALIKSVFMSF